VQRLVDRSSKLLPQVRAGSARHWEPLVLGGHERSRRAHKNRRSCCIHRYDLGRRNTTALGSNPTSGHQGGTDPLAQGGSQVMLFGRGTLGSGAAFDLALGSAETPVHRHRRSEPRFPTAQIERLWDGAAEAVGSASL
jgi:hypothetical protein